MALPRTDPGVTDGAPVAQSGITPQLPSVLHAAGRQVPAPGRLEYRIKPSLLLRQSCHNPPKLGGVKGILCLWVTTIRGKFEGSQVSSLVMPTPTLVGRLGRRGRYCWPMGQPSRDRADCESGFDEL